MQTKLNRLLLAAIYVPLLSGIHLQAAAPTAPSGTIKAAIYLQGGGGLAFKNADAKFPGSPDAVWYPKRFEWYSVNDDDKPTNLPSNFATLPSEGGINDGSQGNLEEYGTRIAGYIFPPTDGEYQFAISCDDPGAIFLSTDENPANKQMIAYEPTWNDKRNFATESRRFKVDVGTPTEHLVNQSKLITLKANKAYYIEAIAKEGGGGDNLAVAWRKKADAEFADGDHPISGAFLAPYEPAATVSLLGQPKDTAVIAGGAASFSIGLEVPPGTSVSSIKWTKNGVDVANSDTGTLTVTTTAADDGAKFRAIVATSTGTVQSSEATLTVATLTADFTPGVLLWQSYLGISGNAVDGLLNDAKYPDAADETRLIGLAEGPSGYADNYGARITGFVVPATSGDYVFFMTSDDNGALWLSTDDKPANKKQIAAETAWSNAREWTVSGGSSDLASKRSDQFPGTEWPTGNTISLVAGKRYYVEGIGKEGGGGDNLGFTMIKAGDADPGNGSAPTLTGGLVGANARNSKAAVSITKQPTDAAIEVGKRLSLTVDGQALPAAFNLPLTVQWQKDTVNIPGATSKEYSVAVAAATDAGKYRAVVTAAGVINLNSTEVTVTVSPDTTGPVIAAVGAVKKGATIEIGVAFDEAVDGATVTAAAFTVSKGTIQSARYVSQSSGAVLVVGGVAAGDTVTVTAKGVKDAKGNVQASTSKDVTVPGKLLAWVGVGGDELNEKYATKKYSDDVVARGEKDFDILSGGSQLWTNYDEETFVYEEITGDFDKVVRVEYNDPVTQWSRAGLDAREALDEGKTRADVDAGGLFSQHFTLRVNPAPVVGWDGRIGNNAYEVVHRPVEGKNYDGYNAIYNVVFGNGAPPAYPNAWLRLKREGPVISTYMSNDGKAWTPTGYVYFSDDAESPEDETLSSKMYVGMFYAPEFNNIGDEAIRGSFSSAIAKFRDYGDFTAASTPPVGGNLKFTSFKLAGGNVTLEWTGTGTLQGADSVTGPWADVAGATSPRSIAASAAQKFYRLKQ